MRSDVGGTINGIAEKAVAVSVIIPVHAAGAKFEACLASATSALRPGDEILVVADGEGDGSWRMAEKRGVRVIKLEKNSGPARARNTGARAARGNILFFMDSDVVVPSGCLEKIHQVFENEPDVAAVIGSYDDSPGEKNFLSQFKNLFHHFVHQRGNADASTFWGACGAIRREVFLELGGFDERYRRPSVEDIELGYRLKAASYKIRLVPEIQVKHLKRWDACSLVTTDFWDRAVPWTELLWDHAVRRGKKPAGELNTGLAYRLSLVLSFLLVACFAGALFSPWWWLPVVVLCVVFVILHSSLFNFFRQKHGRRFAVKAAFLRFVYDLYCGCGFVYGSSRFALNASAKAFSFTFARLDPWALGTSVGLFSGMLIFAVTALLLVNGESPASQYWGLLSEYFVGFRVTWSGSLVGFLYGLLTGFFLGFCLAKLRNSVTRVFLALLNVKIHFAPRECGGWPSPQGAFRQPLPEGD